MVVFLTTEFTVWVTDKTPEISTLPLNDASPDINLGAVTMPVNVGDTAFAFMLRDASTYVPSDFKFNDASTCVKLGFKFREASTYVVADFKLRETSTCEKLGLAFSEASTVVVVAFRANAVFTSVVFAF
jgi:hypothetical protein